MKGYFDFDWEGKGEDGRKVNVRVLFKPTGKCNDAQLAHAIERSLEAVLSPDVIAIICSEQEVAPLERSFKHAELRQAARRASTKVCICLCSFDKSGQISLRKPICNPLPTLNGLLTEHSASIRQAGLAKLFSAPQVFVTAPPGFTFVKPSQKRSTYFLRAEEALTETENVQFLAFCLLERIASQQDVIGTSIDVIFIDSMAIATVAYALRDLYCDFFGQAQPRVVSFHSHDGLDSLDVPLPGTSFCLISASSSMSLEGVWCEKVHCSSDEVVTLLTLKSAANSHRALFALDYDVLGETHASESAVLKDLAIMGERFLPEELLPKKVLLRKEQHRLEVANTIAENYATAYLGVRARGGGPTEKVRPLYFDGMNLLSGPRFNLELEKVLQQKVSATVQAIIAQDDDASRRLADHCSKRLAVLAGKSSPIRVVPQKDVESGSAQLDAEAAVVIVAAVAGRGTKLLSISRDLRSVHKGARTYIVGVQLAETLSEIGNLKGNLVYSADNAAISVDCFLKMAVGRGLSESFKEEHRALRNVEDAFGPKVAQRYAELEGTMNGLAESPFLPTGADLDNRLHLREDFAYWPSCYAESDRNCSAVFATIATILQNAREGKFSKSDDKLGTDAFQQVVLAPENFARYNDGIIQAALLRVAHPSELDYSREPTCSQYMLDFLAKVFQYCTGRQGEAAAEFALALNTERLKIKREHLAQLKASVEAQVTGDSLMEKLVRYLLGLEQLTAAGDLPAGF
ncbi:hypothetical protein [Ralstonia chuxiongensis]|uniref:hypothetical protein n=1 Tax=Ralstonia chuxiongensis TaxID=2957504 RepID=UPI0028F52A8A|nr:hypothetical protein [Ralstonia chuxiongensis]CAJ0773262.1 hypothetical protein R8510_03453 [Ralstonia chuxiongensis]